MINYQQQQQQQKFNYEFFRSFKKLRVANFVRVMKIFLLVETPCKNTTMLTIEILRLSRRRRRTFKNPFSNPPNDPHPPPQKKKIKINSENKNKNKKGKNRT